MKKKKISSVDYSKVENQIGCGYCSHEIGCRIREVAIILNRPTREVASNCVRFNHYSNE